MYLPCKFKDPAQEKLELTQEETNNLRDTKSLKGSLVKNLGATKFSKAYKILKEIVSDYFYNNSRFSIETARLWMRL